MRRSLDRGAGADPRPQTPRRKIPLLRLFVGERPIADARALLSHRGVRAQARLQAEWPRRVLVRTPVHASWLNQIEIYLSFVQRQVLTPNDFPNLTAVRIASFGFTSTTSKWPLRSSGRSPVAIWLSCWRSSLARRAALPHERHEEYVTVMTGQST